MQGLPGGLAGAILFAYSVIGGAELAAAQDMPAILAPPAAPLVAPKPDPAAPMAEAAVPPASPPTAAIVAPPPRPLKKPQVAAATGHQPTAHHRAKFAVLMKRLTAARGRAAHEAARRRVALRQVEPNFPPSPMPPPPGYYPPSFRQHLVYGGPPPGFYPFGAYRERYPYDYP